MTDDELIQFARDFVTGQVYTMHHIRPELQEQLLPQVFQPIAFGALDLLSEEDKESVGAIWAPTSSIFAELEDGYPSFLEMRLMHLQDWKLAAKLIHRLQTASPPSKP